MIFDTTVQANLRTYVAATRYRRLRNAVVQIQAHYRGCTVRQKLRQVND